MGETWDSEFGWQGRLTTDITDITDITDGTEGGGVRWFEVRRSAEGAGTRQPGASEERASPQEPPQPRNPLALKAQNPRLSAPTGGTRFQRWRFMGNSVTQGDAALCPGLTRLRAFGARRSEGSRIGLTRHHPSVRSAKSVVEFLSPDISGRKSEFNPKSKIGNRKSESLPSLSSTSVEERETFNVRLAAPLPLRLAASPARLVPRTGEAGRHGLEPVRTLAVEA